MMLNQSLFKSMNDDELHSLIRQTQPKPEFPASFQREVWARITVAEQQSWGARWHRLSQNVFLWMARPAPAVALVTTMLILGAALGSLTAPDRDASALRTAYAASINPLKAAHVAMPE
jgi:hypothetical protein